ncbi:ATP-binding cassette domain-containing protein [Nocardioides sp. MAH-18]|uniref:ATP-binding cassette domain-containing protein n=2 Tax=Nocardioidaceae TaxID=85015 RepID=A0A6L6XMU3_9ACTN|nr:ATP-binding cassette domain-containing protein [Nocardioides sp. MAH-18]
MTGSISYGRPRNVTRITQPDHAAGTTPAGSSMAETAISLRGLSKHFGTVRAVDDLDLDIADGEFFSMLGPSGSGKTTVLRLIAGFEEPTGGTITLGDEDVTDRPAFARDVNTVFQDYAIFPHMSVLENVEYGLRVKKVGRAERRKRAEEALETVRLGEYGARRPHQLSGGQRQRVALARALVNRPKVLLLDEPLGALDLKLRREMQIELKAIQREVGITFVFVTHDQEEALTMSDRIAVFNEGRIEQLAAPVELYERPASAFVAGFVGTSNLIAGEAARQVVGQEGAFVIRPEKVRLEAAAPAPSSEVCVAPGVVREVVYLGALTSTVVALDAGPTVTVTHPNTDTTIDAALERRDQRVVLTWRREHLVSLGSPDPATSPEEETA